VTFVDPKELYFENLAGKTVSKPVDKLASIMAESFANVDVREQDFKAIGIMRGIGWVGLYQDPSNGRLLNFWINEHDVANPAGCRPLLIMDVFEHVFMLDFGLKRVVVS